MTARVDRYRLCGDDCTTDCGACKGAGRPAARVGQEPFDLDAACQPVARQPESVRTFRARVDDPAAAVVGRTAMPDERWDR